MDVEKEVTDGADEEKTVVSQLRARLLLSRLVPGLEGSAVLPRPEQTLMMVVNEEDKSSEHGLTSEDEEMVFNVPDIVPRCL